MPNITKDFWTDDVQAAERLLGCLIQYGDDVLYVDNVVGGKVHGRFAHELAEYKEKAFKLSDPKFGKFRELPKLGWRNVVFQTGRGRTYTGALYVKRNAVRTRSHGLNRNNCVVYDFCTDRCAKSGLMTVEQAFIAGVKEDMKRPPNFADAFAALGNGTSCALSQKWALHRDSEGLTWLYRKLNRVALVMDNTSLSFLPAADFYVQDAENDPLFQKLQVKGI